MEPAARAQETSMTSDAANRALSVARAGRARAAQVSIAPAQAAIEPRQTSPLRQTSPCAVSNPPPISRAELMRSIVEQSTGSVLKRSVVSNDWEMWQTQASLESRRSSACRSADFIGRYSSSGSMFSSQASSETEAVNIEVAAASKWMAAFQKYMDLWQVQLIFFGVSLAHCANYLAGTQGEDCARLDATGGLVISLTLLELLVRIMAQAGFPWWPSAWRRFLLPVFHVAEVFVVAALIARCGWAMHFCPASTAEDRADVGIDRPSLAVVLYHRAMRAWAIFYGVSVQSTQRHRQYQDCKQPAWWQDWNQERREEGKRLRFRLAGILGDLRAQFCTLLLVVAHCSLYTIHTVTSARLALSLAEATGYLTFAVLAFEFIVRCLAQGGDQFFVPALHKVEVAFLGTASFVLLYPALYSAWIAVGRGGWQPNSWMVWTILLFHRIVRFLATQHDVSACEWGVHSVLEAKAFKVFLSMMGDLLEVSPQNVRISLPSPTQKDIKVRIFKAKLKTEAFQGLHMPIAVRGGLVEALEIVLPRPVRGQRPEHLVTRFVVKNLLLLAGPGGGLGEAGLGMRSKYWVSETVVETKSKLVELICQKLSAFGQTGVGSGGNGPRSSEEEDKLEDLKRSPTTPLRKGGSLAMQGSWSKAARTKLETRVRAKLDSMKEKITNLAQELALDHVEVSIQNVRLEYEDLDEALGYKHAMIGLRVGDIFIHRLLEQRLTVTASRLGISVDVSRGNSGIKHTTSHQIDHTALHVARKKSTSHHTLSHSPTARKVLRARGLCRIIGEHPQKVMDQMNLLNLGEKFRLWAFEALDPELPLDALNEPLSESAKPLSDWQRHRRNERWPERYLVISLLRVSLQAGPSDGNGRWSRASDGASRQTRETRMSLWGRSFTSVKRRSKRRSKRQKPWLYRAHLTPLRLAIDDEQAGYLHTFLSCLKAWFLHDESLRWRPDLMPLCPALRTDELRQERSFIVRLWWRYAVHRVLARLHKQRNVPTGLQVSWHISNLNRYRDLMVEVALRPGAEVNQLASDSWSWSEWEKTWAKELQTRLKLTDIIECRRIGLASLRRYREQRKDDDLGMTVKLAEFKHKITQINMEQITEMQQLAMEAAENWQDRMEGAVEAVEERMETVESLVRNQVHDVLEVTGKPRMWYSNVSSVRSYGGDGSTRFPSVMSSTPFSTSSCRRPVYESRTSERSERPSPDTIEVICKDSEVTAEGQEVEQEDKEKEDEESEYSSESDEEETEVQGSSSQKVCFDVSSTGTPSTHLGPMSANMTANSLKSKTMTPQTEKAILSMDNAAGSWQVTMSGVEIRILRHTQTEGQARAVLLHVKWSDIRLDLCILPSMGLRPRESQSEADDAMQHLKPYTAALSVGSAGITCPDADELSLRSGREILRVTKPVELPLPKPQHLAGSCTGSKLAFAARVGATPTDNLPNEIEIYVADMFVVISTPLLLALEKYTNDKNCPAAQRTSIILDAVPEEERWQPPTRETDEMAEEDVLGKATAATQRRFEMLTGIRGFFSNWSADVNLGRCQILQVSEYAQAKILVEEYRAWPFSTTACRGERDRQQENKLMKQLSSDHTKRFSSAACEVPSPKLMADRWITVESKGLENIELVPWDDPSWLVEEKMDERSCRLRFGSKMDGTASDKELEGSPYLQVHLKGGVRSLSGGAMHALNCFDTHHDWRILHPCFASAPAGSAHSADDLQMPLRFCGATASCSCMISARSPLLGQGQSPQAPEVSPPGGVKVTSNLSEDDMPHLLPRAAHREISPCPAAKWPGCGRSPWCSTRPWHKEVEQDADDVRSRSPQRPSTNMRMQRSCSPVKTSGASTTALRSLARDAAHAPAYPTSPDQTDRTGVEMLFHIVPSAAFGRSWLERLATGWCREVWEPPPSLGMPKLLRSRQVHFSRVSASDEGSTQFQSTPAVIQPSWRLSQDNAATMRVSHQDLETKQPSQLVAEVIRPSRRMRPDGPVVPLRVPDPHEVGVDDDG